MCQRVRAQPSWCGGRATRTSWPCCDPIGERVPSLIRTHQLSKRYGERFAPKARGRAIPVDRDRGYRGYRDRLIERFDFDPTKKVRAYSKGNRQKISLIAALMTRAQLLILDEPTSGLDPLMEKVFRDCILEARQNGQTVFLSSHILSEVEALCDRVAILREGELLEQGTLVELRHLSALDVEATFDGPPPDVSTVPAVV